MKELRLFLCVSERNLFTVKIRRVENRIIVFWEGFFLMMILVICSDHGVLEMRKHYVPSVVAGKNRFTVKIRRVENRIIVLCDGCFDDDP